MKIIYASGCLGFIGSAFVEEALKKGYYVHGVDKETYAANLELLKNFKLHSNFNYIKSDIKNLIYLEDCDVLVNFAAESHVQNSIVENDSFIDSNILGVKNLLDLIKNKHDNCNDRPLMLQISTDEVYSDIKKGSHVETDILKPSNPYSASKAAADMLVLAWARTYKLQYNIVRPTNNYGRYQFPEKLIPLSVKNLLRGKKIRLHDKGKPTRNWLHVKDTVDAIFTILEKGKRNEIYNVSGNLEQSNKETVRKIIKEFFGTDKNWEQYVDFEHTRAGQDIRYSLNDDKIKKLGWRPERNFDEELPALIQHYKKCTKW